MSKTLPQVAIRLPPEVKAFIQAEAKENASSQNSEIVRAIRAAMKAKGPAAVARDLDQKPTTP
ncbi:MAG: Arc family DNA-binding protein [Devosia sp.]